MRARPPWWGAAIGTFTLITGLCCVASYHLRVLSPAPNGSPGVGLGLGLGSGPGRPQVYLALSGDLLVEIRQLPVWARGRRLQLMLLEHASNAPPVATSLAAGSAVPEFSVQGSVQVSIPSNAPSTAANTGGRLQWVRGYNNRSTNTTSSAKSLGKMTSTWRPDKEVGGGGSDASNVSNKPGRPPQPQPPTTLKPVLARFPCGFVSRGGRYALRLAGLDRVKKADKDKAGRKAEKVEEEKAERSPWQRAAQRPAPPSSAENESAEGGDAAARPTGRINKVADGVSTASSPSNDITATTTSTTTATPAVGVTPRSVFPDPALPATNETGGLFLLDVLWPRARLSLGPREIVTYPEESVRASVEFLGVRCPSAKGSPVSESWLELVYCGPVLSDCAFGNYTQRQILHSEQVLGYPHQMALNLQCELFGMAGYYSLHLRASRPSLVAWPVEAGANATIKAVWSDRFVFNVHARSIFPCAAHSGVSALFTYPGCAPAAGDRVRLFARLRADVATLVPPLTLQYVAEQRVHKGAHAVAFDCDLFSERYVEYCFVYVSQAITGAVTDVRMDCVPTLPVSEADSGAWGPWSPWSACTSTCGGGTRNRYRFCDSPPPRYGAKFCEGSSLETMRCGPDNEWDCAPEGVSPDRGLAAMGPEGPSLGLAPPTAGDRAGATATSGCRCGCVVHLGTTKPTTMLASSSKSCPGRSFWLVQADANHVVQLWVQQQRLPCGAQWLRVRDGDSLAGRLLLLLSLDQAGKASHATEAVSSSNTMLVEFFSDEAVAALEECAAGFLAYAQQTVPPNETLVGYPLAVAGLAAAGLDRLGVRTANDGGLWPWAGLRITVVHLAAVAFLGGVVLLSACLCAQYGHRYRKYQLTAGKEDQETLSLTDNEETGSVLARAASAATLVSEVMSLKGFKVGREQRRAHEEETSVVEGSAESVSGSVTVPMGSPASGESGGQASSATVTAPLGSPPSATASLPNSPQPQEVSPMRRSGSCERPDQQPPKRPGNVRIGGSNRMKAGLVSPVREGETEEDQRDQPVAAGQCSRGGASAPSPPCTKGSRPGLATPKWRPMSRLAGLGLARGVASNASSTSTLVNEGVAPGSPASSVRSWSRASMASMASTASMASSSSRLSSVASSGSRTATPTNPRSPVGPHPLLRPGPGGPGATNGRPITPINPKESKDRRNRERLLRAAGPGGGSDFSLGPDTEMELDYYDYNVHNACAAPGSLLGMDPAYLLWIPPFTPGSAGSWEEDDGEECGEEGRLFDGDTSGGEAEQPEHPVKARLVAGIPVEGEDPGTELQELRCTAATTAGLTGLASPRHFVLPGEQRLAAQIHTARVTELTIKETEAKGSVGVGEVPAVAAALSKQLASPVAPPLALQELTSSPRRLAGRQVCQQEALGSEERADSGGSEKETAVVKSPSDHRLVYLLQSADDIKFADDGEDDCEDIFIKDLKVDPKTVPLLGKRGDLKM